MTDRSLSNSESFNCESEVALSTSDEPRPSRALTNEDASVQPSQDFSDDEKQSKRQETGSFIIRGRLYGEGLLSKVVLRQSER